MKRFDLINNSSDKILVALRKVVGDSKKYDENVIAARRRFIKDKDTKQLMVDAVCYGLITELVKLKAVRGGNEMIESLEQSDTTLRLKGSDGTEYTFLFSYHETDGDLFYVDVTNTKNKAKLVVSLERRFHYDGDVYFAVKSPNDLSKILNP